MNKKGLIGLVVVIVVLLVVGFFVFVGKWDFGDVGECVKVQTSCCPCNMGGSEACVLASEVGEHEVDFSECEVGLLCAAFMNCKIESCEFVSSKDDSDEPDGECVAG